MKKLIVNLLLSFFSFLCFTQESANKNKWSIGLNFSPELSNRIIINGDPTNGHFVEMKRDFEEWEKSTFVFTTGIFSEFRLNKLIRFKLGVHFTQKGYVSKPLKILNGQEYEAGSKEEYFIYKHLCYHYGFPISSSFYFVDNNKLRCFTSIGGQFDFFFNDHWKNRIKKIGEQEKVVKSNEIIKNGDAGLYNVFFPTFVASVGLDWIVNDYLSFRFEPVYRLSMRSLEMNKILFHSYFYNYGLNFSCLYSFK